LLGFACPVSEIGAVLPFSGVLGFACPVSEIGALLCGRCLCAVMGGFPFSSLLGFASQEAGLGNDTAHSMPFTRNKKYALLIFYLFL
jgi:hypothetical protein